MYWKLTEKEITKGIIIEIIKKSIIKVQNKSKIIIWKYNQINHL